MSKVTLWFSLFGVTKNGVERNSESRLLFTASVSIE
jgi:hypothetical protein